MSDLTHSSQAPGNWFPSLVFAGFALLISGCQPGTEITDYQAPEQILRNFKADHPAAQSASYRQLTRDGVKVFVVQFVEGEEEKEAWYNVQGKPFVSKADRRSAEQDHQRQQEEAQEKAREEAEEKAKHAEEKAGVAPASPSNPNAKPPSSGHMPVP